MCSAGNMSSDLVWGDDSGDTLLWDFYSGSNFLAAFSVQTGAKAFQIETNGFVGFYSGSGNASDASLKTTPRDASTTEAIAMLKVVSARTYSRLDLPDSEGSRLGFIAQEIEAACPSAWGNLVGAAQYSKESGGAEIEIKNTKDS